MVPESPRNKAVTSAPSNKSPLPRPLCKTCGHFDAAGRSCRRSPSPLYGKSEDEWCGEHPDFPDYLKSLKAK